MPTQLYQPFQDSKQANLPRFPVDAPMVTDVGAEATLEAIRQELITGFNSMISANVIQGSGPPDASLGVSGNLYWDTTNLNLYVKDGTGWHVH